MSNSTIPDCFANIDVAESHVIELWVQYFLQDAPKFYACQIPSTQQKQDATYPQDIYIYIQLIIACEKQFQKLYMTSI